MNELTKILIIDDSEDDRLLYRRALQKNAAGNFILCESDDGEKGLKMLQSAPPSCILLDYSLPGRNGIEILKRIRASYPFIPVVMLTGQGNENVAVAAMQEGAQNYISKSTITPETLEHVIRMAIDHCMMQKRIHEQRTSLEVFTRALAHDLKEPVRTIRSFTELLGQQENFSDKAHMYFNHIQNAADRMYMLIDTVFLYTRLDDPGQMAREVCDGGRVMGEVKENIAQLIHERNAVITFISLPRVYASRIQLIQLFQNLACNAINHSDGPVRIEVSASEQEDCQLFCVKDNGPGIEEPYLNKIFEPFRRLAHHEPQGAGLGLAICRKIVESHGGKIWCESKPGEGAAFFFTLPKALPVEKASSHIAVSEVAHSAQGNDSPLANVLLVDDSRADVEMTRFRLIERSGLHCNFMVAHDAEEALATLRTRVAQQPQIDLMLVDINMPEMDGFELLEQMRKDATLKNIVVVMCSGSNYDKDMIRARELGAAGYLTKPIEFSRLKSMIEQSADFRLFPESNGYSLLRMH